MEADVIANLVNKLFELGVVFIILSLVIKFLWNEIKTLRIQVKERDDFIKEENKANFNVMVQSMNTMKEVSAFLEAHKEFTDITRKQQASIIKLLKDKNNL